MTIRSKGAGAVLVLLTVLLLPLPTRAQNNVYLTEVDEYNDDIFELANGAIFEKTSFGYVGYVGYATEALLYSRGNRIKLWVQGEGVIDGELIRAPDSNANAQASVVFVMDIRGNGRFLELDTGSLLEVSETDTIFTELWLPPFEAILLNDGRLLNLNDPSAGMVWMLGVR